MHRIILALACLACAGYGRRVQFSPRISPFSLRVSPSSLLGKSQKPSQWLALVTRRRSRSKPAVAWSNREIGKPSMVLSTQTIQEAQSQTRPLDYTPLLTWLEIMMQRSEMGMSTALNGREWSELLPDKATANGYGAGQVSGVLGEWAFMASISGKDCALHGHIFLHPSGHAAYMGDGINNVGRGVGHWVADPESNTAGVELQIFQYPAAAVDIPERGTVYYGVWPLDAVSTAGAAKVLQGDWYVVQKGVNPPQLVGSFEATPSLSELLSLAMGTTRSVELRPHIPVAGRDAVFAALRERSTWAGLQAKVSLRLLPFAVSEMKNLQYIPNFITEEQEKALFQMADGGLRAWDQMQGRISKEWGMSDRCICGRGMTYEALPPDLQAVAESLHKMGAFDADLFPMNSVRLNGYIPGEGIHPHCDGPVYYPKVALLSLGSSCNIDFYPTTGNEDDREWDQGHDVPGGFRRGVTPQVSVHLEPRSLLIFSTDAFWIHRHGIDAVREDTIHSNVCNIDAVKPNLGDVVPRSGRRVSFTMRHLLPRCGCQSKVPVS